MNKKLLWITRTAIFIALIIVVQVVTKPAGQFVTGSLVNLILLVSVFTAGLASGITVAALSPVFAFFVGIGPAFVHLVPVVALGNIVLVWLAYLLAGSEASTLRTAIGIAVGAVAKFLVLWVGIVQLLLPNIPGIKEKQIQAMTAAFSWPQLVTALIGGAVCLCVLPVLKKALKTAN